MTPAVTHAKLSSPFTIGLSSTTVKPGAKLTISGLAYARAGLSLTIMSDAIASAQAVNGVPAVQTPALVEGIYHTTVRVPPATEPGVYSVQLRFGNRQVASISNLRVVAPGSPTGGSTGLNRCAAIGFTVLHNDRAGTAYLPGRRVHRLEPQHGLRVGIGRLHELPRRRRKADRRMDHDIAGRRPRDLHPAQQRTYLHRR